jgi:hypothetical protein
MAPISGVPITPPVSEAARNKERLGVMGNECGLRLVFL